MTRVYIVCIYSFSMYSDDRLTLVVFLELFTIFFIVVYKYIYSHVWRQMYMNVYLYVSVCVCVNIYVYNLVWGEWASVFVSDIASIQFIRCFMMMKNTKKSLQNICINCNYGNMFFATEHRTLLFLSSSSMMMMMSFQDMRKSIRVQNFQLWELSVSYIHDKKNFLVNHNFCHHSTLEMVGWWRHDEI